MTKIVVSWSDYTRKGAPDVNVECDDRATAERVAYAVALALEDQYVGIYVNNVCVCDYTKPREEALPTRVLLA